MGKKQFCITLLAVVLNVGIVFAQGVSISQKVDLGLSVCWAGYNVGASSPEGFGDTFAWGETETKSEYDKSNYRYSNSDGMVDIGSDICGTRYDVARVKWGGNWRMPTAKEWRELLKNCTWKKMSYKDVNGYKVTGPNGNSIFLPVVGDSKGVPLLEMYEGSYWSGTIDDCFSYAAYRLGFSVIDDFCYVGNLYRALGCKVRPVCDVVDSDVAFYEEKSSLESDEGDLVHITIEEIPEFPGGQELMYKWLAENVQYPEVSLQCGYEGRVIVRFVVSKDGSVCDAEVVCSSGDINLDKEALRVVGIMPKWKAGRKNGIAVRCYFTLPLSFSIHKDEKLK